MPDGIYFDAHGGAYRVISDAEHTDIPEGAWVIDGWLVAPVTELPGVSPVEGETLFGTAERLGRVIPANESKSGWDEFSQ